jgi:minor extracellular serine protease Vpr
MLPFVRSARTIIILMITMGTAFGAGLTEKQRLKLHPFFQSVVAKSFPQLLKTTRTWNRLETTPATTGAILYDAIVYTRDAATLRSMGIRVNSVLPDFVTAQLSASEITRIVSLENVRYLDPGSKNYPQLDVSTPETGASLLHSGFINSTAYKGSGAIVVIYDTGIDWKHFDFRKSDTTKSRILCIWDQTLDSLAGDFRPTGFSYGVEYTHTQIENELDGTPAGYVREMDINGHGTHVASTAAGNGLSYNGKYIGVAPDADIIVVKGGNGSFSEIRMIDGLTYAQNKAAVYNKPIAFNWSSGRNDGPHDGTCAYEVAVDNFVATPGRVVCISAGNNGADTIHVSGSVSSGSPASYTITVPTYTPKAGIDNDYFYMTMWLPDSNAMDAKVTSPTNIIVTCPSNSDTTGTVKTDGTIEVANYISNLNSHRNIYVYVHDFDAYVPKTGNWTITLSKTSGSTTFDGWLAHDSLGGASATLPTGNTSKTVDMPGTSRGAITVASYATKWTWTSSDGNGWWYGSPDRTGNISTFSSIGPTADNRQKPDIAAPGQAVVAAFSRNDVTESASNIIVSNKYLKMQGTSMACPHVTGGAALLLGANPSLTAAQIKSLFTSTANSDSYATGLPNYIWGYGKFDVLEAMAKSIWSSASVVRTTLAYDGTTTSYFVRVTGTQKAAVRFSPTTSGTLTGIQVYITSLSNRPIVGSGPLVCDVYTDNAGLPGTKIGTSVSQPFSMLSPYTNNYIQMTSANVNVTSGTDYHVVLSVANTADSVLVRYEGVTSGTHSSTYNGSTWNAQTYNIRLRSIITTTSGLTSVDENLTLQQPQMFRLNQNYPNPFNPTTKITYTIPTANKVTLKIFNLLGQLVATLVDEQQDANTYMKEFDASRLASGTYFYQINAGNFNSTKKMILMK